MVGLFFKSGKIFEIGPGVSLEYGHIHFPSTLRCTKTKSEVLGLNMTKFSKNGGLNFLYLNGNPGLKFELFCIAPIFLFLAIILDMHKSVTIIINNLTPYLNKKIE